MPNARACRRTRVALANRARGAACCAGRSRAPKAPPRHALVERSALQAGSGALPELAACVSANPAGRALQGTLQADDVAIHGGSVDSAHVAGHAVFVDLTIAVVVEVVTADLRAGHARAAELDLDPGRGI